MAVVSDSPVSAQERPEPPNELTPEQRIEWIKVVNTLPSDWFEDYSEQTLVQYCRHVIDARRIANMIESLVNDDDEDVDIIEFAKIYTKLLKEQRDESRIIASLMTKMRLTQQATYHPEKVKGGNKKAGKPWEL